MSYTYDSAHPHHVKSRTDAKLQQTQYDYDDYGRATEIRHYSGPPYNNSTELLNQRVDYKYDTNVVAPGFSQNAWGRLTEVAFSNEMFVDSRENHSVRKALPDTT